MPKESTFKNMAVCLTVVCLVCSAVLAGIYVMTRDAIAAADAAKTDSAIALVVPSFDNKPSEDVIRMPFGAGDTANVYVAMKAGETVGYAIEVSAIGFGGEIRMMVGIDSSGNVYNTSVISHAETPGLGSKMTEEAYSGQYVGKNPSENNFNVTKDGGEIVAITASTITSRAYSEAVKTAFSIYESIGK